MNQCYGANLRKCKQVAFIRFMMSAVMLSLLNQCYINVLREQQDINRFMYSVGGSVSRLTICRHVLPTEIS